MFSILFYTYFHDANAPNVTPEKVANITTRQTNAIVFFAPITLLITSILGKLRGQTGVKAKPGSDLILVIND